MNQAETNRFNELYQSHLRLLKLQGKSQKTIDAYARAVRRISEHFDCCPDQLTLEQREKYWLLAISCGLLILIKSDSNENYAYHLEPFMPVNLQPIMGLQ